MPVEPLPTPSAPPAVGPYSPAVRAGDWLVLSGQVGLDSATGGLVSGGVEVETRQAMRNITAVLADCDASLADIAKATIFVTDLADFPVVNEVYGEALGGHRPARSTVGAAALLLGAAVEIEVWAHSPIKDQ